MLEVDNDDILHKEKNKTLNKKLATSLNENSPSTLHKRSATTLLVVNKPQDCYTINLLLLISNKILSSQKTLQKINAPLSK